MTLFFRITVLSVANLAAVYAFVSAPAALPEITGTVRPGARAIPIARVFDAANAINHEARRIYTARIVGAGKQAGLDFAEEWRDRDRQAGPLPALFMRQVSWELTRRPEPLALFLGSDEPINRSNLFAGEQSARFALLKANRRPQLFAAPDGQQVAMYPDIASAKPCVTCHNEHKDSPKKDWVLDDVMGASTWTYPASEVSPEEFQTIIRNVYGGVEGAWRSYLDKTATFDRPPPTGAHWPGAGARVLPDAQTFMAAVFEASAPAVIRILIDHQVPGPLVAQVAGEPAK